MAYIKETPKKDFTNFDLALEILYSRLNADEREAFKKKFLPDKISKILDDPELVHSLEALFEKSLNISEASRTAFIHRNTLVYRLNKMKEITGLDFSSFEDAAFMRMCIWLKQKENQSERSK